MSWSIHTLNHKDGPEPQAPASSTLPLTTHPSASSLAPKALSALHPQELHEGAAWGLLCFLRPVSMEKAGCCRSFLIWAHILGQSGVPNGQGVGSPQGEMRTGMFPVEDSCIFQRPKLFYPISSAQ